MVAVQLWDERTNGMSLKLSFALVPLQLGLELPTPTPTRLASGADSRLGRHATQTIHQPSPHISPAVEAHICPQSHRADARPEPTRLCPATGTPYCK